ncbi:MAG: hypothetical protein R3264_13395, partial [Anaerolineae bacterium]|nr:hypothetical protein [Anaerolineae bacterium]
FLEALRSDRVGIRSRVKLRRHSHFSWDWSYLAFLNEGITEKFGPHYTGGPVNCKDIRPMKMLDTPDHSPHG